VPGASSGLPGTFEDHPFTIGPNDANGKLTVRIDWQLAQNDFDMFLYKVEENGDETLVGQSTSTQGSTNFEEIVLQNPAAGDYIVRVDNWASADPRYTGSVTFEPPSGDGGGEGEPGTGAYTVAEKDAWVAALREYAKGGGNLVLTDGALRALPDLAGMPSSSVARQTVYAGQTAFATGEDEPTLDDPLAANVDQEGARFGSGFRRQTFEPTPLGFAIQNAESGADESHARQYDVSRAAWEAAGGRTVGTSVNSGTRDAQPVYHRVTLGELPVGDGQIRIAGALLPQPSQEFDHTLGLEPYATTYTGYIVARNLLEVEPGGAPAETPTPPGSGGGGEGGGDGNGGGDGSGGGPVANQPGDPQPGAGVTSCERGTKGSDKLRGHGGDDCLKGHGGDDVLRGGNGDDRLSGGTGNDRLSGGPGADVLKCGSGSDVARTDGDDEVRGCEKVRER
jgi:Ca2+-binding RTX toxin-like protein